MFREAHPRISIPQFSQEISTLLGQVSLSKNFTPLRRHLTKQKQALSSLLMEIYPGIFLWPACSVKLKIICRIFMGHSFEAPRKAACDCHCLVGEFFIEISENRDRIFFLVKDNDEAYF
jgi:hypothetical protein